MKRFPLPIVPLAIIALAVIPSRAQFLGSSAIGPTGIGANISLDASRLRVTIGPAWLDVEEEAEFSISSLWGQTGPGPWLLDGTYAFPRGAVVTGCFLWNDDTLLQGKLRGRSDANRVFDSLVPPPPVTRRDPLLVEQVGDSIYHMKLFPVSTSGSRRIRLRYLVPRGGAGDPVSIFPVFLRTVVSMMPSEWSLEVRGKATNPKIRHDGAWFPLEMPASRIMTRTTSDDVALRWGSPTTGGRAIRGSIDSGAWQGDYVLYTGEIPDTIGLHLELRSETVFLWKWNDPRSFLATNAWGGLANSYMYDAIYQAQTMVALSDEMGRAGNKVGLVADQGIDDSTIVFPVSDTTSSTYRRMREWLSGIDETYMRWKLSASTGIAEGTTVDGSDLAHSQMRFSVDVRLAGTLYSRDSGIIRHLVVVTVGPVATGYESQVAPDLSGLPSDVSVASSQIISSWEYSCNAYECGYFYFPPSHWPGIDLNQAVLLRPGTGNIDSLDGVPMPKLGTKRPVVLSMTSSQGILRKEAVLDRTLDGKWQCSLDLQARGIGNDVNWTILDDDGNLLRSRLESPTWYRADADSAIPFFWASSPDRVSPNFPGKTTLAPVYGFVDREYSLLATPSDSVGLVRQGLYSDSGLPFLGRAEIFPKVGYTVTTTQSTPIQTEGVRRFARERKGFAAALTALRQVRISFQGLEARSLEIRDVRGHKLTEWNASSLAGATSVVWTGRNAAGSAVPSGLYVIVLRTAGETLTTTVALP
jgi:hypothetical protein